MCSTAYIGVFGFLKSVAADIHTPGVCITGRAWAGAGHLFVARRLEVVEINEHLLFGGVVCRRGYFIRFIPFIKFREKMRYGMDTRHRLA